MDSVAAAAAVEERRGRAGVLGGRSGSAARAAIFRRLGGRARQVAPGSTDALSADVAQWALIVLTAYFGGRSLEKVARILGRKCGRSTLGIEPAAGHTL